MSVRARIRDRTVDWFCRHQTLWLERYLVFQAGTVGLGLLGPWQTYYRVTEHHTVLSLAPDWVIGWVLIVHASLLAAGLTWRDDEGRRNTRLCRRAVLGLATVWMVLLGAYLVGSPLSVMTLMTLSSVFASLVVYLSLHWRYA